MSCAAAGLIESLLSLIHILPVFQPASLRPQENQQLVSSLNADVMVVVAYGLILPKAVLDLSLIHI